MPRKQRIHYEGALYHVMARGNNGEYIIKDEQDKKHYLDIVKKYKDKYKFKIYAYCLMDNHVHMLIEVTGNPLAKIMQGIQQVYTQHYNKKNKRTGHVFQQRYKAIVCNKEGYLLHLIKYIHYNPVEAKQEGELNYKWSSHNEYKQGKGYLADIEGVLKIISKNKTQAIKGYIEYMKGEPDDIEEVEYRIEEAQSCKLDRREDYMTLEELIESVVEQEGIEKEELKKKKRKHNISDIRKAIIKLSEEKCNVTNKEIAYKLEMDITLVSKIKNDNSRMNEKVKRIMEEYNSLSTCQA